MAPASTSRSVSWLDPGGQGLAVHQRARAPRRPWPTAGTATVANRRAGPARRRARRALGVEDVADHPAARHRSTAADEVVGEGTPARRRPRWRWPRSGRRARRSAPPHARRRRAARAAARPAARWRRPRPARGCTIDGARASSIDVSVRPAWASRAGRWRRRRRPRQHAPALAGARSPRPGAPPRRCRRDR